MTLTTSPTSLLLLTVAYQKRKLKTLSLKLDFRVSIISVHLYLAKVYLTLMN